MGMRSAWSGLRDPITDSDLAVAGVFATNDDTVTGTDIVVARDLALAPGPGLLAAGKDLLHEADLRLQLRTESAIRTPDLHPNPGAEAPVGPQEAVAVVEVRKL